MSVTRVTADNPTHVFLHLQRLIVCSHVDFFTNGPTVTHHAPCYLCLFWAVPIKEALGEFTAARRVSSPLKVMRRHLRRIPKSKRDKMLEFDTSQLLERRNTGSSRKTREEKHLIWAIWYMKVHHHSQDFLIFKITPYFAGLKTYN